MSDAKNLNDFFAQNKKKKNKKGGAGAKAEPAAAAATPPAHAMEDGPGVPYQIEELYDGEADWLDPPPPAPPTKTVSPGQAKQLRWWAGKQ